MLVFLSVLLVVGSLGATTAYLISRGKAGIPGGPRLGRAEELRLVPGTCAGFIHVRWRNAQHAGGTDELRQIVEKASPHAKAVLDPASPLDLATLDRLTIVFLATSENSPGPITAPKAGKGMIVKIDAPARPAPGALVSLLPVNSVVVLSFTSPFDFEKARNGFLKTPVDRKLEDRSYAEDLSTNVAVYAPDRTTLVLGDANQIVRFIMPSVGGALTPAVERAAEGGRHVVAAFDMGLLTLDAEAFQQLPAEFQPVKEDIEKLAKVQFLSYELAFGEETKTEVRAKFRTAAQAEDGFAALRRISDRAREAGGEPKADPDKPEVKGEVKSKKAPPEVVTRLFNLITLARLNEWLGDSSSRLREDEIVTRVPKAQSPETAYPALALTTSVLFKPANRPKAR